MAEATFAKSASDAPPVSRGRVLTPSPKNVYFGALDGCRGVLALMVAIFHTPWASKINNTPFLNQGAVIIDLFFVFSGFLMFTLYRDRMKTKAQVKTFLWRRFARLYPIHVFMTLVFLAFAFFRIYAHQTGLSGHDAGEILPFQPGAAETGFSLLTNLSLTQALGFHESLTYNPPAWTISAEFFAYFTFAALLFWFMPRTKLHFIAISAAVLIIYAVLSRVKANMDITYDLAFWRCLAGFYTGVVGAEIYRRVKAAPANDLSSASQRPAKLREHALEIVTLTAYILFVIYMPGKLQFFIAPFALLFVLVFAFDKGIVSRVFMWAPFAFLAKISYSVYMVHVIIAIAADIFAAKFLPAVNGVRWHDSGLNGDLYLIPYLIAVIITGYLLQRFIEAPCAKVMGQWYKTRSKAKRGAAPA